MNVGGTVGRGNWNRISRRSFWRRMRHGMEGGTIEGDERLGTLVAHERWLGSDEEEGGLTWRAAGDGRL